MRGNRESNGKASWKRSSAWQNGVVIERGTAPRSPTNRHKMPSRNAVLPISSSFSTPPAKKQTSCRVENCRESHPPLCSLLRPVRLQPERNEKISTGSGSTSKAWEKNQGKQPPRNGPGSGITADPPIERSKGLPRPIGWPKRSRDSANRLSRDTISPQHAMPPAAPLRRCFPNRQ